MRGPEVKPILCLREGVTDLARIRDVVDYTADISQASASLRMQLAAAATAAPLCGDDLFAYERTAIIRYDIRLDILISESKAVANQIGQSVASCRHGAKTMALLLPVSLFQPRFAQRADEAILAGGEPYELDQVADHQGRGVVYGILLPL